MIKQTKSSPWAEVDAAREKVLGEVDPYPDRSFTTSDYVQRYGLGYTTAVQQLRALVAKGVLVAGKKWAQDARGHRVLTKCFWLPEKKQ